MEILAKAKPLRDGRTPLVIRDAYNPNFAVVSNYDAETGSWSAGKYFDGELASFADYVLGVQRGLSWTELADMLRAELEDVEDLAGHFEMMGWSGEALAALGYDAPEKDTP